MAAPILAETLIALVESFDATPDSGVVVTSIELDVPLEATVGVEGGDLVVRAGLPHTRWVTGVLPPVHKGKLTIELVEEEAPQRPEEGP